MSLVSALSKLLVKMGGTPSTGDTSDELVDKIADTYAPGGGGALVVHVTVETVGQDTIYTTDKTAGEIINAMPLVFFEKESLEPFGVMTQFSRVPSYSYSEEEGYNFELDGNHTYEAATLNDYPSHTDSGK